MLRIVFRNLDRSELARTAVRDRLQDSMERFPDLKNCRVTVTLSMDNSPHQAGPDLFRVKLYISLGRYRGVLLEKQSSSLYLALADLNEGLLERLNRFGDRARVKARRDERQFAVR